MNQFGLRQAAIQHEEQRRAISENQAREAQVILRLRTVGSGVLVLPDEVSFGIEFTAEPIVTHGCVLDTRVAAASLPLVTAGVYRWSRNDRGFYTGAHLFARVDTDVLSINVDHSIVVQGPAYKVLDESVRISLDALDLE